MVLHRPSLKFKVKITYCNFNVNMQNRDNMGIMSITGKKMGRREQGNGQKRLSQTDKTVQFNSNFFQLHYQAL